MSFTVLIVEDEDNARTFFSSLLTSKGYEIAEATTLEEAHQQIDHGKADIILLDVLLPDGSGLSLLDYVVPLTTRPPIILMTGHGDIDMAVEAMKNATTKKDYDKWNDRAWNLMEKKAQHNPF